MQKRRWRNRFPSPPVFAYQVCAWCAIGANAEFRMQNSKCFEVQSAISIKFRFLNFAFCTLHFAFNPRRRLFLFSFGCFLLCCLNGISRTIGQLACYYVATFIVNCVVAKNNLRGVAAIGGYFELTACEVSSGQINRCFIVV